MPTRSKKTKAPADSEAKASGMVAALTQDVELTAEQIEHAAAAAFGRLGGPKSSKARAVTRSKGRRSAAPRKPVGRRRTKKS